MKNLRGFKSNDNNQKGSVNPEELIKNYGDMSEDALFETLLSEVAAAKSKGTFSEESLKTGVDSFTPYLSDTQKTKLEHLLRLISSN